MFRRAARPLPLARASTSSGFFMVSPMQTATRFRSSESEADKARRRQWEEDFDRQRYHTLGDYIDRLPRGIKDLLLWSPALALAYFVIVQQTAYFVDTDRPFFDLVGWYRGVPSAHASKSSLLQRPPAVMGDGKCVLTGVDGVRTQICRVRDSHGEALARGTRDPGLPSVRADASSISLETQANALLLPSPPVTAFTRTVGQFDEKWDNIWRATLRVCRDPMDGRVIGYTIHQ